MIRRATAGDAPGIAALDALLFPGSAWTVEQVAEELTGYGRLGWVSAGAQSGWSQGTASIRIEEAPEALTGYVIMRTVGDVADLQRIGVAPSQQRAGIAGSLLAAAGAGVREEGAERILLEVAEDNAAARSFYAREGFVEIDRRRRYYRGEVDALVLQRGLAQ